MPDQKINFCSKFGIKTFRATVVNAGTRSLTSLHSLFDTYLDHMLAKFEPNRIIQNVENFQLFDKKQSFFKAFLTKR